MGEEPFCARCARHIRNCCQVPDIYVTPGDVERISLSTGGGDFYEFRASADPAYVDQNDDPTWRQHVIREDGTRRTLKHTAYGNCIFLGPCGCTLALGVRPLVCRLFPFDYTEQGIKEELAPGCPVDLLAPGQDLIECLGMTVESALRWHRQLYQEIRWEKPVACELV